MEVKELSSDDEEHLALLNRPELGVTFSKLNAWRLEQYSKCVFLDADTLVLTNVDELFEREELSAAPDIGWPDIFNSGVFVFCPNRATFNALMELAQQEGSFDGENFNHVYLLYALVLLLLLSIVILFTPAWSQVLLFVGMHSRVEPK